VHRHPQGMTQLYRVQNTICHTPSWSCAINLHALGAAYDAPIHAAQGTVKQIVGSTLKDVEERYLLVSIAV
jgi:hypothetical protein